MANTRPDVVIPQGVWVDLYAASSVTVGTAVELFNKGSVGCCIATSLSAPSSTTGIPFTDTIQIAAGELGLWAYCLGSQDTRLIIRESVPLQSNIVNNSVPITASSGNVANATASATLAAASGKNTYISGFQMTASGATLGSVVTLTVTGTVSGTLSYTFAAPSGVLLLATPLTVQFNPPIPSSSTNHTIVVSCPALGAGNTNATICAQGYQL